MADSVENCGRAGSFLFYSLHIKTAEGCSVCVYVCLSVTSFSHSDGAATISGHVNSSFCHVISREWEDGFSRNFVRKLYE